MLVGGGKARARSDEAHSGHNRMVGALAVLLADRHTLEEKVCNAKEADERHKMLANSQYKTCTPTKMQPM